MAFAHRHTLVKHIKREHSPSRKTGTAPQGSSRSRPRSGSLRRQSGGDGRDNIATASTSAEASRATKRLRPAGGSPPAAEDTVDDAAGNNYSLEKHSTATAQAPKRSATADAGMTSVRSFTGLRRSASAAELSPPQRAKECRAGTGVSGDGGSEMSATGRWRTLPSPGAVERAAIAVTRVNCGSRRDVPSLLASQAAAAVGGMGSAAEPEADITMGEFGGSALLGSGEQACSTGNEDPIGAGDTRGEREGAGVGVPAAAAAANDKTDEARPDLALRTSTLLEDDAGTSGGGVTAGCDALTTTVNGRRRSRSF